MRKRILRAARQLPGPHHVQQPYKRVTDKLGALRMAGALHWNMVLDLTRELDEWQTYGSPREARARMRRIYDEDRWLGQKHFPILVVEKDTLEPVCKPMAGGWQMPFASSRGYSSLKLQHDVARLLNRRYTKIKQTAIIYFISDLDPSGLDLQRAWEEALGNFRVVCTFVRVGLTPTASPSRSSQATAAARHTSSNTVTDAGKLTCCLPPVIEEAIRTAHPTSTAK